MNVLRLKNMFTLLCCDKLSLFRVEQNLYRRDLTANILYCNQMIHCFRWVCIEQITLLNHRGSLTPIPVTVIVIIIKVLYLVISVNLRLLTRHTALLKLILKVFSRCLSVFVRDTYTHTQGNGSEEMTVCIYCSHIGHYV